jgi:hypothetical protein
MAAMLVFSAGLIMMLGVTRGLSQSLEHSALNSLINAEGQERMDSLTALTFATLTAGTRTDTLTYRGVRFRRAQTITACPCTGGSGSPLTKRVTVTITPLVATGPTFSTTGYVAGAW